MTQPQQQHTYTGPVQDGPLAGQQLESRFLDGVFVVDYEQSRYVRYDYRDGAFYVHGDGWVTVPDGEGWSFDIAEGVHYDLRAYEPPAEQPQQQSEEPPEVT